MPPTKVDSSLDQIAQLRVLVGYLGEKEQNNWWGCSFFSEVSGAYLDPVFPRTAFLARCHGVKAAASLVHDERIGVGRVYHLFRLPEHTEQKLHHHFLDEEVVKGLQALTESVEAAEAAFEEMMSSPVNATEGPTHCGKSNDLAKQVAWEGVASLYHSAFKENIQTFPYFTDSE
jgi:hypothetical protein